MIRLRSLCRFFSRLKLAPQEPMAPILNKKPVSGNLEDAVKIIQSGDRIFIHGGAATPTPLVIAMTEWAKNQKLRDINISHLHTSGPAPYASEENHDIFKVSCLFVGDNLRQAVNEGNAEYIPIFLSEIPALFRRGIMPLNVALIHVSPPDRHGFCSLGVSVDVARAALQCAGHVIGMINNQMPRTHGDGIIHISHFDTIVEHDTPIHTAPVKPLNDEEIKIGQLIAECLIVDGATLQMGIGTIPNAVLRALEKHRNLGIHTEMFSDGVLDLVKKGVITNAAKELHTGKIITSFCIGSEHLYDFINDNPLVNFLDVSYVNNPVVIASQPKMTSINSCVEIDLTGQVVSDSIGTKIYSGVGGQVDFVRGSALAKDGRPIVAMTSRTHGGISRIVPFLKQGGGVVTSRAHVHYVVTEYGIGYLFGKSLKERAKILINIAHPDDREMLERAAFDRYKHFR